MPTFLHIPKAQLAITLSLILLTALIAHFSFASFRIIILSLIFTISSDLTFTYLRKKQLFIPYAALVTGLILSLTISPRLPWYEILFIASLAMGAKNFVRINNHHIFNPAATGLVLGGILLREQVSWWGVSFQTLISFTFPKLIFFIILLSPLLVSALRMRRYGSILSFLTIYVLLIFLLNHFNFSTFPSTLLDPTVIFFSIVMLPEPMTSPVQMKRQILYGSTVAVLTAIGSSTALAQFLTGYNLLPDSLLPFLLIGNLMFFRLK